MIFAREKWIEHFRQIIGIIIAILINVTLPISTAVAGDLRGGIYGSNRFNPQPVPVFGARVDLVVPQTRRVVYTAFTGPDGMYYMRNIRPGDYQLQVNQAMTFPLVVDSASFQDIPPIRIAR